jgi:hypothetical protein
MTARPAPPRALSAEAVEFVRFCYARRRVGWPELYDEMCAVAGRGLFRGWGPDELAEHGVGFGLFDMPRLAAFVNDIVTQDRARAKIAAGGASGEVASVAARHGPAEPVAAASGGGAPGRAVPEVAPVPA